MAGLAALALLVAGALGSGAEIAALQITAAPAPRVRPRPGGATLAVNGLSRSRLAALTEALERLARKVAQRKNPLYVPLDDSDDGDRRAVLDASGPLAVAAALAAGRWQSAEADLTIRAVGRCRRAARCVRLGAGERLEPRHRFLAWPLGYALVVTAGSASGAAELAERLRDGAGPQSRIALVLAAGDLHQLRPSDAAAALLRQARRLVAAAPGSSLARALAPLASADRAGDEVPWLRLPASVVLVIPRLSALAAADVFLAEVRAQVPGLALAWLSPP